MKVLVTTAAFYPTDAPLAPLKRSCERNDLTLIPYGLGQSFHTFLKAKMIHLRKFLTTRNETLVLFTDAVDSLVLTDYDEIVSKWMAMESPLVLSAESSLWPQPQPIESWTEVGTPWRFLCAFGVMGLRTVLIDVLDRMLDGADTNGYLETPIWQKAFLAGQIPECRLDTHCQIFQVAAVSSQGPGYVVVPPRIINSIMRTKPCVVHVSRNIAPITDLEKQLWPIE
jgi:hypothetical protein